MDVPCAFVVPLDETVDAPAGRTGYRQVVHAGFGVVLVVSNEEDERGQGGYDSLEELKLEVFRGILCWAPGKRVGEIAYGGASLLDMDRSRLFYQLEFGFDYQLTTDDTHQPIERDALGVLDTVAVDVVGTEGEPGGDLKARAIFNPLYNKNRS